MKIRRLINRHGLEGYGLYNLILESITESLTSQSPMPDLQETCADIAEFYNADTTKVEAVVKSMLEDNLFGVDEITGRIVCTKLYKFLEASQTRSKELRNMIREYKHMKELPDPSDTVTDICDKSEEENRKEENRKEEKKPVVFESEFNAAWDHYPRKINRKGAYKAYVARRREGIEPAELEDGVRRYAKHVEKEGTEQQYMLHGSTFFGPDERWKEYKAEPEESFTYSPVCPVCGDNFEGDGVYCGKPGCHEIE